jgi:Domain of unknown function (DUF4352)
MNYHPDQQTQVVTNEPYYQQPKPPKKSLFKKKRTWFALLGVVIVFVIIANANQSNKISSNNSVQSGSDTSTNDSNSSANTAKVGDTITVNDVACTLVSVKKLASDEYNQPKAGNRYIVVHVKIVNHGDGETDYNMVDFHAKSSSGDISDSEGAGPQSYTANDILTFGKIAAGGNVEGDVILQVPINDHHAELTWQPSFLGNAGDNAWDLDL